MKNNERKKNLKCQKGYSSFRNTYCVIVDTDAVPSKLFRCGMASNCSSVTYSTTFSVFMFYLVK